MLTDSTAKVVRSRRKRLQSRTVLLPPSSPATANSRQSIEMSICPDCRFVHELGGTCLPRHSPIPAIKDLSGHGNDAGIGDHSNVVTGERGLAIQMLEDSYLYVNGRGIDVDRLTLSVRLYWLGGAGVQTIVLAKDSFEHRWGTVMYSLGIADSQGTIMYGLGRQDGGGFTNTTATGAKLPPNQWHLLTLTYDGRYSRLYMDGVQVHSKDWTYTYGLIHPPDPDMFLSRCPGGVQFNGYLDDFTLWNRSLTQGEIRAQYYLDRGLNGIVVPRGLFFNSEFFESLNTTTWSYSNPLLGSMVMGNDNPLELNSRVVQQLIAANLTLEEAWTWLNKLMKNETGKVTSFPLVVTSEIYTIGFDAMLMNVLPNMTVENSGNSSEPPPPIREPTFWEKVWNSFTGLVSAVWNAVVAVATFVANVILAVVKWGIGLAVAIASGQGLQYFYDTVVKPFVDLVLWFIRWIMDLVKAAVNALISVALAGLRPRMDSWALGLSAAMKSSYEEFRVTRTQVPATLLQLAESFFLLVMPVGILFALGLFALGSIMGPFAYLVAGLIGIVSMSIFAAISSHGSGGDERTAPNPPDSDKAHIFDIAIDARQSTLDMGTQGGGLELQTVLDWFLLFLPAILSILAGAIATGVDVLEYVSIGLLLPAACAAILADAAVRFSHDQATANRIVAGYGWFAVVGLIFNLAALAFGVVSKSPGGVFLASVGIALGSYGWWLSDDYLRNHPVP